MKNPFFTFITVLLLCAPLMGQNEYELEDKAWSCMQEKFASLDIDIDAELTKYEEFLVAEGFLPEASAAGYMAVFQRVIDSNELTPPPIKEDYFGALKRLFAETDNSPCLNREEIAKTKIYELQVEGQKALSAARDVSPVLIAEVLMRVYSEKDFEHPLNRFSIFFNISQFVNIDSGIKRLPPPPPPPPGFDDSPVAERNLINISLNADDEILFKEEVITLDQLKSRLLPFVRGSDTNDAYPELKTKSIALLGEVPSSSAVVAISSDRAAKYATYRAVQQAVVGAFKELRSEAAQQYFQQDYDQLSEAQQEAIKELVPIRLTFPK